MVIHAEKIVLAVVIMLSVVARHSHSLGFRSQRLRMKAEESFASFGIFRQVKRMKATAGTEVEGETVRLISGEEAKIIARGRAGWISVQSLRTNEVRAYFIFPCDICPHNHILSPNCDCVVDSEDKAVRHTKFRTCNAIVNYHYSDGGDLYGFSRM